MLETNESRKNRTNATRPFPNLPLESLRITGSDSFVPHTEKGRWSKNLVQPQGPRIQPRHSSSCDSQMQLRREDQPKIPTPPPVPNSCLKLGYKSGTIRSEGQSYFQAVERPTTHSESPTGLYKPLPIAISEWNQLHGFPRNTIVPDKDTESTLIRPSSVKNVVANIRKSAPVSESRATSAEVMNGCQKRETRKSPKARYAMSTNCIYEPNSTIMWRKIFPNTSDTAMDRVLSPSLLESSRDDLSSICSSSDHTIVGQQSITTDDTLTEERLAALNDCGGQASVAGSVCTARLVSRSPTSEEEENFYMAPQNASYQIPYQNTNKSGVLSEGLDKSWSTYSMYESATDEPISTSTRKSSPASVGSVSDTFATQSSQFLMNNDFMMGKNPLSLLPNKTRGYLEKMQNVPQDQIMHFAEIGSYIKECYDHCKVCDVRFRVNDEVLYAHRAALCSMSPYFESIFTENSHMKSKQMAEIRLRGLSMQSLKAFMNFVYAGKLEITTSTILDLVKISRQFQIPEIRERCLRKIGTLPHDDLVALLVAVRKDPESNFIIPILRCISQRFLDISQRRSFLELDIETLRVILSHDELVTSTEMDVFCAGLEWINACPGERSQYLGAIMKCIRFPLMSQQDLVGCIDRCSLLAADEKCLDMIYKANWIRTVMALNRQDPLNLNIPESRYLTAHEDSNNSTNYINNNATPVDLMDISFGSIESYENYTESFNIGSRESLEQFSPSQEISAQKLISAGDCAKEHNTLNHPSKPDLNENPSMIVLDQKLYVIGGLRYNNDNPLPRRDVWVFCPKSGWRKLTPLRTARHQHALCVFDGCIYAIGGLGRNNRILKSVECYNPSTNSWHFLKSLTTARAGACAAELNGNIFVAGGFGYRQDGSNIIFDSVECYHPFTNRWTAKGSLRYGRCHATMTSIGNSLYLSGGLAIDRKSSAALSVQDVDLYDTNKDSWMLLTYMDKARHSAASFTSGNKMYLIGGSSTNRGENLQEDIECWNVQRNTWLSTFELPVEVQWIMGLAQF
ncbi:kelch-like protein 3 [Saccostrea echinata]|uniref:kelch-like protein 3 n=1 Tax=Saccostrea echinata TaxID=191078 RepID=UPI002A811EED|nr:kelch-like protein 3 [Saccostrea echinata]